MSWGSHNCKGVGLRLRQFLSSDDSGPCCLESRHIGVLHKVGVDIDVHFRFFDSLVPHLLDEFPVVLAMELNQHFLSLLFGDLPLALLDLSENEPWHPFGEGLQRGEQNGDSFGGLRVLLGTLVQQIGYVIVDLALTLHLLNDYPYFVSL